MGEQGSNVNHEEAMNDYGTLSILGRARRCFSYPISAHDAELCREVVVGLCRERLYSDFGHLARLTCETPESVRDLWTRWNARPEKFKSAWREAIQ
jgi:hypothetical protein